MAITIKVEPQTITPAYNEVMIVLDSDNKSEPKFQYIVNVNVEGVFSSRLKVQSNPQGYGVVNISKHLESYVSDNINISDKELFKEITHSYIKYDISLSEEYVLTSSFISVTDNAGFCQYNFAAPHNYNDEDFVTVSGSTVSAYDGIQEVTSVPNPSAILTSKLFTTDATGDSVLSNGTTTIVNDPATFTGDKYALNNVLNWIDVPNWDSSLYNIDNSNEGKFLTNIPSTMTTRLEDRITLNFFNDFIANEAKHLKVVSNKGTYYFDNINPIAGDDARFMSVGCGAFDILNAPLSVVAASDDLPIIDATTSSYTVELVNATLQTSSESHTFEIDRRCAPFEVFNFLYLNKGGSFTPFNFELASSKSVKVNKKTYNQNYGSYDPALNSYGWDSKDSGVTRLDSDISETYTVTSNYVKDTYSHLIIDLITSPLVYHLTENKYTFSSEALITSVTNAGSNPRINFSSPHGLSLGDIVKLGNFADHTYNTEYTITGIPDANSYVIDRSVLSLPQTSGIEVSSVRSLESDGVIRSVEIKSNSMKIKRRSTDGLINYSINFNYTTKNTVQK